MSTTDLYVPIYKWGNDPDSSHGTTYATHFYTNLYELYMIEPEAVGHFVLTGYVPTKNEFERSIQEVG